MGVKWAGGRDIAKMAIGMRKSFEATKVQVYEEMEQSIEIGGQLVQDYLEAAHTETGIRRHESKKGGFPGRHESGNMVASVSYGQAQVSRSRRQGFFGWFAGQFEAYFRDQDVGGEASDGSPGEIPAANALPNAFGRAREVFRARLLAMGLRRR